MSKFIPRSQMQDREYEGYVGTSRGVVPQGQSSVYRNKDGQLVFRSIHAPIPQGDIWGVEPSKRRTPQERVESLAQRIQQQSQHGMPASVRYSSQSPDICTMGRNLSLGWSMKFLMPQMFHPWR